MAKKPKMKAKPLVVGKDFAAAIPSFPVPGQSGKPLANAAPMVKKPVGKKW